MKHAVNSNLSKATFERRCVALYNRLRRFGIGKYPAYIEPRVERQAMREAQHDLKQQLRARAAKRHAKKHNHLCRQAKAWKAEYDDARRLGERFVHAEPKPHPLIVALRQTAF